MPSNEEGVGGSGQAVPATAASVSQQPSHFTYGSSRSSVHAAPGSVSSSSPSSAWTPSWHQQDSRTSPEHGSPQDGHEGEVRKRKRIQQACKACSFRRVKCDGQRPCQTCIKNGDECLYGQPKKRGPAKGTTRGGKRAGPLQRSDSSHTAGRQASLSGMPMSGHGSSISLDEASTSYPSLHHPSVGHDRSRSSMHSDQARGSIGSLENGGDPQCGLPDAKARHSLGRESDEWTEFPQRGPQSLYTQSPDRSHRSAAYPDGRSRAWSGQRYEHRPPPLPRELKAQPTVAMDVPSFASCLSSYRPLTGPSPSNENARSIHSQRPAHIVPPGPAMQHGTLAHRLHRNTDAENEDLADMVLAQLYRQRRAVRRDAQHDADPEPSKRKANLIPSNSFLDMDDPDAPVVSDEIEDRLFEIYRSVISLHWPMFPRRAYPTVRDLRGMVEGRHPLLLNAICSISALVWDEERDGGSLDSREHGALSSRQLSTIFSVRAHYHHIAAIMEPCLESTAALVLLSLRETGAGRPSQAAHYCWTACRMAMDLGLHRHAEMSQIMGPAFTPLEDETRRRVYWSVFVIDKMMAVQLGRPPVLRDAESDCPLPSFDGEDDIPTWSSLSLNFFSEETNRKLGPKSLSVSMYFINGCRLACISEGIVAQYNVIKNKHGSTPGDCAGRQHSIADLHRRLEEWEQQTPVNIRWRRNASEAYFPFVIHQQAWAQACKILLHRPYILRPTDEMSGINSHAECSKATDLIWQMFCDYERLFCLRKIPSSMVYCLFSAATIALANTTSTEAEVSSKARQQLSSCVRWFIRMTETWSSATQHLAILEKLATTINVDLSATGLQAEDLRFALQQKMDADTLERLGGPWTSTSDRPLADGHSGSSHMRGVPSLGLRQGSAKQSSSSSVTGDEQPQSIDAFWPDMPLGEDFQRWISFTQTYFSVLGNTSNTVTGSPRAEFDAEDGQGSGSPKPAELGGPSSLYLHNPTITSKAQSTTHQPFPPASDSFYPSSHFSASG